MTRSQIKIMAKALLGEDNDAPGTDPLLLDLLADQAVNEVCRATGCYYLSYTTDLVNGQQSYCAPPLYQIRTVIVTWADGTLWPLRPKLAKRMDEQTAGQWRPGVVDPTINQGNPLLYIPDGENNIRVYPVPNYSLGGGAAASLTLTGGVITSCSLSAGGSGYLQAPTIEVQDTTGSGAVITTTIVGGVITAMDIVNGGGNYTSPTLIFHTGGLIFEGLAVPKDGSTSLWPLDTDEPPIPARSHDAIPYKIASIRSRQRAAAEQNPFWITLSQTHEADFARYKGYAESEAAKFTDATKYRAHTGGGRHWGWAGVY